jgi:hypothetical protein
MEMQRKFHKRSSLVGDKSNRDCVIDPLQIVTILVSASQIWAWEIDYCFCGWIEQVSRSPELVWRATSSYREGFPGILTNLVSLRMIEITEPDLW